MATAEKLSAARLEWLDLFRGLAVVWMIETHVANTFLQPQLRETAWFGWLNYVNGLVAPAFLFIAGYVLGVQSRPGIPRRKFPWKKLRRLGEVALIGYALHFPWEAIAGGDWRGALHSMWIVDVLQCLSVSLAALVVLIHTSGKWSKVIVAGIFAMVVFASPWAAGWRTGFLPLDAYLNQNTGSLFPLFPWLGFVFAGFIVSQLPNRMIVLLPICAVLASVGLLLPPNAPATVDPIFFFERLSRLIALVILLPVLEKWCSPEWLRLAGRQSLTMYVSHLLMIYLGLFGFGSLATRFGGTFGTLAATALFLAILFATLGFAFLNEWRWRTRVKR